jgi:hypothetical protein
MATVQAGHVLSSRIVANATKRLRGEFAPFPVSRLRASETKPAGSPDLRPGTRPTGTGKAQPPETAFVQGTPSPRPVKPPGRLAEIPERSATLAGACAGYEPLGAQVATCPRPIGGFVPDESIRPAFLAIEV